MKKFEGLGKPLSKADQKGIMGGNEPQAPCSVTCNAGYYSCCYAHNGYNCECVKNGDTPPQTCTAGGLHNVQLAVEIRTEFFL